MKNYRLIISLFAVSALLISLTAPKQSHKIEDNLNMIPRSGGVAAVLGQDRTGGPLSSGNCSSCHSSSSSATTVQISFKDSSNSTITQYTPGSTYTIEFNVSGTSGSRRGFQGVVLNSTNGQAGVLSTPQAFTALTTLSGRQYIEHSSPAISSTNYMFKSTWTAPSAGTGNITVYAMGLAANNNGTSSGDIPSFPVSHTINESPSNVFTTDNIDACGDYVWTNGITYTMNNNTAKDTINLVGYDSIISLNLTITRINKGVTVSQNTITATQSGATYQWLDCNISFAPITGQTSQSFTATIVGSYAVEITLNGCVDTSTCSIISTIGIVENNSESITISPNPFNNFIFVKGVVLNQVSIQLFDITGKNYTDKISISNNKIETSELPKGIYLLKIDNKTIKLVK